MEQERRILSLALNALYAEREKIDLEIEVIEKRLGETHAIRENGKPSRRQLSAAARRAISNAQKKRWAAYNAKKASK